jgi:hypothetical protein
MASSSSSGIRDLLGGYLAGRVAADRLVPAIAAEFYGGGDARARAVLAPLMAVVERAAPGIVQLAKAEGGAGFDIRLAERPFPAEYEVDLRRAAQQVLSNAGTAPGGAAPAGAATAPGFWGRLVERVRRLFSASD